MQFDVAIFAVDPGSTSGVARCLCPKSDSVWKGLKEGWHESWEVEGDPARQAWEIVEEYAEWVGGPAHKRLLDMGVTDHYFVIEDFVVALGEGAASKRNLLDPVRVSQGIETLAIQRSGVKWFFPEYCAAHQAKGFATNTRLHKHGLWVKGSDHRRDAVRHLCRRYATYLGAHS